MALYASSSKAATRPPGKSEFEILKESHKFLREEEGKPSSWDEQLAAKYYESLYREFAVCDLKHYKSGNFSLRWRTEDEVISGAGETTCGNTRCEHHTNTIKTALSTLEVPFAYVERGENKSALVKLVLCGKCLKKLMWKRRKEKETSEQIEHPRNASPKEERSAELNSAVHGREGSEEEDRRAARRRHKQYHGEEEGSRHRKRSSRSRSPRERYKVSSPQRRDKSPK